MKKQLLNLLPRGGGRILATGALLGMVWGSVQAEDPLPSEMMPLAADSLLLDIEQTPGGLVVVGERGHALTSADGTTFTQHQTPVRATLNALDFVDGTSKGWAVGHDAVILATTDGGKSWSLQNWDPELEKPLLDVMFLDDQRGFAIGAYGLMLRTTNGGNTWEAVENDVTLDEWHFTAMRRMNDGALLLAGEAGGLALSRDDGETWVQLESPYEGSYFGALPWGEKGALVFGLRGNVYMTQALPGLDAVEEMPAETEAVDDAAEDDSGDDMMDGDMAVPAAEWTRIETNTVQSFMGGSLLPNGGAILVGVNGIIMTVAPSGSAKLIPNPATLGFSAVVPTGGNSVLVVGEGGTHTYNY